MPHAHFRLPLKTLACAGLLAAACSEDKGRKDVEVVAGIPCSVAADCAGKLEVPPCQEAVCGSDHLCALASAQDGTRCGDGLACTGPDYCLQGQCFGPTLKCDDEDPCTENQCDNKSGCIFTPLSDTPCDDHDVCTENDTCKGGVCQSGTAVAGCCRFDAECEDSDPCTDDRCRDNACTHALNFAPCDDHNPCTAKDHCDGEGGCAGDTVSCDDGNPCSVDTCDPATGKCGSAPATEGTSCEDGNPCTIGDTCAAGFCEGGGSVCQCTTDADCADFEDGDLCNGTLVCVTLRCVIDPLTVIACNPTGDTACVKATCDPESGECYPRAAALGTSCDDHNPCTGPDACTNGLCIGEPQGCDDGNPCTFDACSPVVGCVHTPNTLPCNDHNVCTQNDRCQDSLCAGTFVPCDDQNPCTNDSCLPRTGCSFVANTLPCNDGNSCTTEDVCADGVCTPGLNTCQCQTDGDCAAAEDGNLCNGTLHCVDNACAVDPATVVACNTTGDGPCRKTTCLPASGACVGATSPDGTPCNDGSACTGDDQCASGACVGQELACDDQNPCTTDTCDVTAGCVHTPNALACDDGNSCTGNDKCGAGGCAGVPIQCDDGNPCTVDTCDPALGCRTTPAANGTACNDGNACTASDACTAGVCGGAPVSCDDGNPCTSDLCQRTTGCQHPALADNTACSDGSVCTAGDHCVAGTCTGAQVSCDDGNACTADSCNAASGCAHASVANGAACSDGDPCTAPDQCNAGACVGGSFVCGCQTNADCAAQEDGNRCNGTLFCDVDHNCKVNPATIITCAAPADPCLAAVCAPATGACSNVAANNGASCSDQDACTTGDVCVSGVCRGAPKACDDGNPCTADRCEAGVCKTSPAFDGQACADDGNSCTRDVCQTGACAHPAVANNTPCAQDANTCTADVCTNGTCGHPAIADGLPCADDGNNCTYDQCTTGTCRHISNDPAPVGPGQCFPVKQLTANTGNVTGAWTDCGVADQFNYKCTSTCSKTGAITNWPCADPTYYYSGANTGYEYAYVFVAPVSGICTFIEHEEGIKQPGNTLFGVIDWFILDGADGCNAGACLEYVWENKKGDAVCGGGQNTCSYKDFATTAGQVFYVVADIFDGTSAGGPNGGHQSYAFPSGWTIEMKCRTGSVLLLDEDFSDAVCDGCTTTKTGGAVCNDFGWHAIGGFGSVVTGYYLGDVKNNTLLGYNCGATTAQLAFPSVTLPATATSCSLSFDLLSDLDATDNGGCTNDLLSVMVDPATSAAVPVTGATCAAHTTSSNPVGFETTPTATNFRYDLTAWKGQTLQVRLDWAANAVNNAALGVIIDNVRVQCDVP